MCKLFILTNASKLNNKTLETLLKKSSKILTPNDKDGFGWSAMGTNGTFGERYLGASHVRLPLLTGDNPIPKPLRGLFKPPAVESWGTPHAINGGLLVHARYSTNTVSIENSHPHRNETHTLIHNGVVQNIGESYPMKSSCDTEHLLHHLSTKGIQGMVKNVSGYYAVGAFEHASGNLILIRDDRASLFGCFVEKLNSLAFSTSSGHLKKIMTAMAWKHTPIEAVSDNIACAFDRSGALISQELIMPSESLVTSLTMPIDKVSWRDKYYETEDSYDPILGSSERFEDRYTIMDADGELIPYSKFEALSQMQKNLCEVIDATTGRPVDLSA